MAKEILVYIFLTISLTLSVLSMIMHLSPGFAGHKCEQPASIYHEPSSITLTDTSLPQIRKNGHEEQYQVKGIDLSHWDGTVDWPLLKKEPLNFVFIKATQGDEGIDPNFPTNWASAKEITLTRGAYHFYQPDIPPIAQANHFLKTVPHLPGDLIPVLDIEIAGNQSPKSLSHDIRVWLETVEKSIGKKPMIYTDAGFWNEHLIGDFSEYPLWIAEWENNQAPTLPHGWQEWAFWQYAASGKVKGVPAAKVDLDVFAGNDRALKRFLVE